MILYLSCLSSKGLDVSVVYGTGRCLQKSVKLSVYKDSKSDLYANLINAYKEGLKLLRSEVENYQGNVTSVVIETNNSVIKKWLEQGYSIEKYNKDFFELLSILDDIPMTYKVIYTKNIKCRTYADKKYVKKDKLTGIDELE